MIRRRFLDWSEPVLPELVRTLVDEGGELDLSGHSFVFPGSRPGRRLVELLVEASERAGLLLTPPSVLTIGSLPERLYSPSRPLADPVLSGLAWSRALRDTPRERIQGVVPDVPDDSDLAGWSGLARVVRDLHEEIGAGGLDFRDVARRCGGTLLFDDSFRWEVLADVRSRYLNRLGQVERSDRDEARIRALEEGSVEIRKAPGSMTDIHLVGVVDMPEVTARMVRRIGEAGAGDGGADVVAWIHAPEELSDRFDDLGRVRTAPWLAASIPVDDDDLAVRDGPGEQADEVVRTIASYGGSHAPDDVSVGVPDREVVPWITQRLESHEVAHRDAVGFPLERTEPFRLLEATAAYLDGGRFADLAALLRHPRLAQAVLRSAELEGGFGPSDLLEAADRYHAEHLPTLGPGLARGRSHDSPPGPASGRAGGAAGHARSGSVTDLGAPRVLSGSLEALHGEGVLGPLAFSADRRPGRTLSGWMPEILGFLKRIYGDVELPGDATRRRRIVEACGAIRDAAVVFHELPPAMDEACPAPQAIRLLLAELRGPANALPPASERAAVEMLGWLELHLDDAPALILTGLNEGSAPGGRPAHLFLPDRLRSVLGLRDDDARRARDGYLLSAILASRKRIRIVAGRRSASGDPLRPSRLLLTDRRETLARRVLAFVGEDAARVPPLRPPDIRPLEGTGFSTPPEPVLPVPGDLTTFRVTELGALLRDPYLWVLQRRLGREPRHDRHRELDPLGFGSMAHRILEAFCCTERDRREPFEDERDAARCLDRLLEEEAERRFGENGLPAVPLQVEQLRQRLRAFADWHVRRTQEGWQVLGTEISTPPEGVPFDVDGEPIRLKGRIDRVEFHAEREELAVLDYKTGERVQPPERTHREYRSGEWRDLQLPLYRHVLPAMAGWSGELLAERVESGRVRLGYVAIPGRTEEVGELMAPWDASALESAFERLRAAIRELRGLTTVTFDPGRARPGDRDPLRWVLGHGILVTGGNDDSEGEDA